MRKSFDLEMMDNFSIDDERIDKALAELKIINRYLGGDSASLKGFKIILKNNSVNHNLKVLDAGSGSSDILLAIKNSYQELSVFSLDLNLRACKYALHSLLNPKIICGNVHSLPFKNSMFDVVHASLFFHHFNEDEIKEILPALLSATKYGLIINDLRRSIFAFIGIKILTLLFSNSEMVKNDGPLSVRRGFIKKELVSILDEIKIESYTIKRTWAFRWLVVINKN